MKKLLPRSQALRLLSGILVSVSTLCSTAFANVPGGVIPGSPNVTVVDNGDNTVTMSNGIVAITFFKDFDEIHSIKYTFISGGSSHTVDTILIGTHGRDRYSWGGFPLGSGTKTYNLATDPASNGGNYADVTLTTDTTGTNGVLETHYSMLRGSPGFYTTGIMKHRSTDGASGVGVFGMESTVTSNFNWVSQDADRNHSFSSTTKASAGTYPGFGLPHEMGIVGIGDFPGHYGDKFVYGQDHGDLKAFGFSSVSPSGLNYGSWVMTNMEFSNGGRLKRDVFAYGNNLNNGLLTGELNQGNDGNFVAGEPWTKVIGPFFNYYNHLDQTDPKTADRGTAANSLFDDANAQDAAEKSAWPYSWFVNPNYPVASGRGTVTGRLSISDSANRNPPVQGTVVALLKQPLSSNSAYDFSKWLKEYQYFTTTDSGGYYTFKNVRPDTGYTVWAYGPGAPGTFQSQEQTGGNAPLELTQPSPQVSVDVSAGATTAVPAMTWNVKRVGNTVFEIGVPDRKAGEFRHGDDFWLGDDTAHSPETPPLQYYPDSIFAPHALFTNEFPNGVIYNVGSSRWSTDWNYVLPTLPGPNAQPGLSASAFTLPATATIHFNLAAAPPAGAQASLFLGIAGDSSGGITVSVNGTSLCNNANVTSAPIDLSTKSTYTPVYEDDSSTHLSNHGPYSDERFTFDGSSFLHAGDNTVTLALNNPGDQRFSMLDYLRFELAGYVPPPPASVKLYAGNNRNLVTWPIVPGATRYALWRSTTSGSGYTNLASGIVGAVSGGESSIMTYTDTTALNNTTYYYVVQSINQTGTSAYSPVGTAKPLSTKLTTAPVTPTGLQMSSSGHHKAAIIWSASPGADYYKVYRTMLVDDGTGHSNDLRKNLLSDTVTNSSFTDSTPSDGRIYAYTVVAVNSAGSSAESADVQIKPMPAAPGPVGSVSAIRSTDKTKITINFTPATSGDAATGYVLYYSTSASGPFSWPYQYVGTTRGNLFVFSTLPTPPASGSTNLNPVSVSVSPTETYYFQLFAVNVKGASTPVTVTSAP